MRRLLALVLTAVLWFSFAPTASADVAGLTPVTRVLPSSPGPKPQRLSKPNNASTSMDVNFSVEKKASPT